MASEQIGAQRSFRQNLDVAAAGGITPTELEQIIDVEKSRGGVTLEELKQVQSLLRDLVGRSEAERQKGAADRQDLEVTAGLPAQLVTLLDKMEANASWFTRKTFQAFYEDKHLTQPGGA